jgi:hypothetical protein
MSDCVARLNDDLARIRRWSISNGLLLNPNKTKAMFICRSQAAVALPPVVVAGVTIPYSSKVCDFDDHNNDLCSRVHYSLRNLWSASVKFKQIFKKFRQIEKYRIFKTC